MRELRLRVIQYFVLDHRVENKTQVNEETHIDTSALVAQNADASHGLQTIKWQQLQSLGAYYSSRMCYGFPFK